MPRASPKDHSSHRFSHLDLRFENAQQGKDFFDLTSGRRRLRPGEKAVEFPDHDHVARAEVVQQTMQLGAVPATTGGLLLEQPRAARATGRHARTKSRRTHRITGVTCLQMTSLFPKLC